MLFTGLAPTSFLPPIGQPLGLSLDLIRQPPPIQPPIGTPSCLPVAFQPIQKPVLSNDNPKNILNLGLQLNNSIQINNIPPGLAPGGPLPIDIQSSFFSPRRPGYGKLGDQVLLRANHFQVKIPGGHLHHYEIVIQPDKCPRRVNR